VDAGRAGAKRPTNSAVLETVMLMVDCLLNPGTKRAGGREK